MLEKYENEKQCDFIKRIVYGKLVDKTINEPYEELSECLFGDGNCFNESEVRKRMYGMLRLLQMQELESADSNIKTKILCLSDFHVPFQLPIETFSAYRGCIDTLVLNGDLIDLVQLSKFRKVHRNTPMDDIVNTRQYLISLIEYINPKNIYVTRGNHENRLESYLSKNLDNDLYEMLPRTPLDLIFNDGFNHYNRDLHTKVFYEPICKVFSDKKIIYNDSWFCQVGDVIFAHPIAYSSAPLKTAEKCVYWMRNEGYNFSGLVMAHTHRIGSYKIGNTTMIEEGCCCDVKENNYRDGLLVNEQKEGFVYLCLDKNEKLIESSIKLTCLN